MTTAWLSCTLLVLSGAPAPAAPRPLEHNDKLDVYTAQLENGLRVVLAERRAAPVVSVFVAYRVGSRDERTQEAGLAHFLEHMMFKGTPTMPKGGIDKATQTHGGANNAFTNNDFTAYFFDFPAQHLDVALKIEADRMRNCLLDPKEFEAEKAVVIQEIGMNDDSPWSRLEREAEALAFLVHPYHHPVLGWQQEIERLKREDMKAFYDRYYQPNNATVVVCGAIEPPAVLARIQELFGSLPRGTEPERTKRTEPAKKGARRSELLEPVNVPRLSLVFRTVRTLDAEDPALDCLSEILASGKTSRLYKRLILDDQTASTVNASNDTRADPGVFTIDAEGVEDAEQDDIEDAVFEEIDTLAEDGPTEHELERAKNRILAHRVFRRETASGLAQEIVQAESIANLEYLADYEEKLRRVTAGDVKSCLERFLSSDRAVVVWSLPDPELAPAQPEDMLPLLPRAAVQPGVERSAWGVRGAPPVRTVAARRLPLFAGPALLTSGVSSGFRPLTVGPRLFAASGPSPLASRLFAGPQRSTLNAQLLNGSGLSTLGSRLFPGSRLSTLYSRRFEDSPAPKLSVVQKKLDNGLVVLLMEKHDQPVLALEAHVNAGQRYEPTPGLAYLLGKTLPTGAGERTEEEIADAIEFVGGSLDASGSGVSVDTLAKDSRLALDLFADVLRRPTFPADAVEREKAMTLAEIAAELDEPRQVADKMFRKMIYGEHPYARDAKGTAVSVKALRRKELAAFHDAFFVPNNTILCAVGDFDADTMMDQITARFADWQEKPVKRPTITPPPPPDGPKEELREQDRAQVNVFLGHLGLTRKDPDYIPLRVMDNVFGVSPGFTDRLSSHIRDELGLCYTVTGGISGSAGEEPGTFRVFVATKPDEWRRARGEIEKEIRRITEELVSEKELAAAKTYLTGSYVFQFQRASDIANTIIDLVRFDLGFDYPERYLAEIRAVTPEQILEVARTHLHPDQLAAAAVGKVDQEPAEGR